jgi:hypothetical protein
LTNSTAGLNTSDSSRGINPKATRPLGIGFNCDLSKGSEDLRLSHEGEIITDASERNTEKTFFIARILPFLS